MIEAKVAVIPNGSVPLGEEPLCIDVRRCQWASGERLTVTQYVTRTYIAENGGTYPVHESKWTALVHPSDPEYDVMVLCFHAQEAARRVARQMAERDAIMEVN